jgi:RNA polymerase sigma-70 factor (ECF subfamily)
MEGDLALEATRRARAGDGLAFEVLAERHAPDLYRLAAAIVGEADARDLTQESLLAAWTQLPRLRDPDRLLPWLRRILVNRCRNHLRNRGRRPSAQPLDAADIGADGDFTDPVHARLVLDGAFDGLSDDQRAVLALHYAAGLSIRDAADVLGVRVGTAKSRLNAALTVMRQAIGPAGEGS